METPATVNLGGDRFVPFIRTLAFLGYDFTGATFAAQVRTRKDGGTLKADLGTVVTASAEGVRLIYGGTALISAHIAAGRLTSVPDATNPATGVAYVAADSVTLSQLGIRINETTMEAMPYGDDRGEDEVLYWDLHITPSGGTKDKYAGGTFTVRAGVTE